MRVGGDTQELFWLLLLLLLLFTCRQLTVSEAHADVVQSHGAAVPEAPAGADENHLSRQKELERVSVCVCACVCVCEEEK